VPHVVAPPPGTARAAQGRWPTDAPAIAAPDRADSHHDAPETDPTLPIPAATARTVAAGVLLAAAAAAGAGVAVLTLAALRLIFSGDGRLSFDGVATVLLAASFAAAYAATLAVPTRLWTQPRPATLVLAFVVSMAWPQSGYPLPAAVLATVAVGLSLARDRRCPGDRGVRGGWTAAGLAAVATILGGTGLVIATTHPLPSAGATRPSPAQKLDFGAGGSPFAVTNARPARTATPRQAAPATPHGAAPAAAPAGAGAFVRGYYAALDARRFERAWARLSPAVRAALGGFDRWRAGYARTVSSRPGTLAIATQGELVMVQHRLLARDRGCAGPQRFSVTWRLRRVSGTWSAIGLRGSALDTAHCG
jgi:hypothetical protein